MTGSDMQKTLCQKSCRRDYAHLAGVELMTQCRNIRIRECRSTDESLLVANRAVGAADCADVYARSRILYTSAGKIGVSLS